MKTNYYYLWNYTKFPFIYSIMNENEINILIIDIRNNKDYKFLLELEKLQKIDKIILKKSTVFQYITDILYRICIYPLKKIIGSNDNIIFYLDGFTGYYPIWLSNLGIPDEVNFYEEGESFYKKNIFFQEASDISIKGRLNRRIKDFLKVPKNNVNRVSKIYVRNKLKFLKNHNDNIEMLSHIKLEEINEAKILSSLSNFDKIVLKTIFLKNIDICLENNVIILTQPLYQDNILSLEETKNLFDSYIFKFLNQGKNVYIKLHPREEKNIYYNKGVIEIPSYCPFELLTILNVRFDLGVTYHSTAINSEIIKEKIIIYEERKK